MNMHADKTSQDKTQTAANGVSKIQYGGGASLQIVDNRPEAVAQRKRQALVDDNPKIEYVAQLSNPCKKNHVSDMISYHLGKHGAKKHEQNRLMNKYKCRVDGSSFESEHIIGYAVLAGNNLPRGKSDLARFVENTAPAYQEHKPRHRKHDGTGAGKRSNSFRQDQRKMLTDKDSGGDVGVSNSVQFNQLYYGEIMRKDKSSGANLESISISNDSFNMMVDNFHALEYVSDSNRLEKILVSAESRLEMKLARYAAITGVWPVLEAKILNRLLNEYKRSGIWPAMKINIILNSLNARMDKYIKKQYIE